MQRRLSQTATFLAIALLPQLKAQTANVTTKSHRAGMSVSDNNAMKAWLAKIPGAPLSKIGANPSDVKITNIDVKWKQTNTVRIAKHSWHKARKNYSYTCVLNLTIGYQESTDGEPAPDMVATPEPITVNSRCDTFLAKNHVPTEDDPNS